jgi:S1-C subfamily serine protease
MSQSSLPEATKSVPRIRTAVRRFLTKDRSKLYRRPKAEPPPIGVIVDAHHGYVLTANHVVANATAAQIRTKNGRKFAAKVLGRDAPADIAVLQIREPPD